MPTDSQGFISEWKGRQLDGRRVLQYRAVSNLTTANTAIVEQVKDGSTFRLRLLMPEGDHQFINLALAGVRCARSAGRPGEVSEPWGDEVSVNHCHLTISGRRRSCLTSRPLCRLGSSPRRVFSSGQCAFSCCHCRMQPPRLSNLRQTRLPRHLPPFSLDPVRRSLQSFHEHQLFTSSYV